MLFFEYLSLCLSPGEEEEEEGGRAREHRRLGIDPHLAPKFYVLLFLSADMTKAGGEFGSSLVCAAEKLNADLKARSLFCDEAICMRVFSPRNIKPRFLCNMYLGMLLTAKLLCHVF